MQWDSLKIPLLSAMFATVSRSKAKTEGTTTQTETYIDTALVEAEAARQNASFDEWCRQRSGRKLNHEL